MSDIALDCQRTKQIKIERGKRGKDTQKALERMREREKEERERER